jgi:5-methylcytosine-specific restriction endonuclease McrA
MKRTEYYRRYRLLHRENIRERDRKYNKNPIRKEKRKVYDKLWRERSKIEYPKKCKERKRNSRTKILWREKIGKRDGMICKKCGATENLTINHIVPKCIGGKYSYDNLEILCFKCNLKEYHLLVKKALLFYFENKKEGDINK